MLVAGIPAQWQTESRLLPALPSGFAFSWTTEVYILHLKKSFWEREDPHRSSDSRNLCGPWWPSLEVPALPIVATLSGSEPGPGTSDSAGEPWPLFPQRGRDVPLQPCQATCSLLKRALLTLWFLRHGLPASGRGGDHSLLALGSSQALGYQKGWEIYYYVLGLLISFEGEIFSLFMQHQFIVGRCPNVFQRK